MPMRTRPWSAACATGCSSDRRAAVNGRMGRYGPGRAAGWAGAAGAALAAAARLLHERSGGEPGYMPLGDLPAWLAADVSVLVAAIAGGAVGQILCALVRMVRDGE